MISVFPFQFGCWFPWRRCAQKCSLRTKLQSLHLFLLPWVPERIRNKNLVSINFWFELVVDDSSDWAGVSSSIGRQCWTKALASASLSVAASSAFRLLRSLFSKARLDCVIIVKSNAARTFLIWSIPIRFLIGLILRFLKFYRNNQQPLTTLPTEP